MIRSLDGTYLSVSQCWNNDTINSILKKMRSGTKGLKDWQLNWTGMSRTGGKENFFNNCLIDFSKQDKFGKKVKKRVGESKN